MAMTNAERQRRYRERRDAGEPVRTVVRPKDRRPRPRRWADAVEELRALQTEYEAWLDQLPEALADSRTAELLEGVCDVDLDVELPRGLRPRLNARPTREGPWTGGGWVPSGGGKRRGRRPARFA